MKSIKLSRAGRVRLPEDLLVARNWRAGMEFVIEDRPEGVLLRPLRPFAPARIEDVFGSAGYEGPPKTIEEMDVAVALESKRSKGRR